MKRKHAVSITIFALFLFSAGSLGAQAAALPDALFLEVVTASGYSFMDGCADPGAMSGTGKTSTLGYVESGTSPVEDPAESASRALSGGTDHASHHPGAAGVSTGGKLPEGIDNEKILSVLNGIIALFGSFASDPVDPGNTGK